MDLSVRKKPSQAQEIIKAFIKSEYKNSTNKIIKSNEFNENPYRTKVFNQIRKADSISRELITQMFLNSLMYVYVINQSTPLVLTCVEFFEDEQTLVCVDDILRYVYLPLSSIIYITDFSDDTSLLGRTS